MTEPCSEGETVGKILARVSGHLDALAAQVFTIEQAVGATVLRSGNTSGATITEIQGLDFLRQSLEDMALLMHLLNKREQAQNSGDSDLQRIAQRLKLNSTQKLLSSEVCQNRQIETETSGELDLF
ncbi:hypothetical protein [Roseobacter ponti]|uniref:Chemotaxis protein n=1 Tax=Roseobacter ponti TaxID=1891787 RepID=A0A858SR76_9RHOB|nr:hypothetical protein [Roseobacter ponti]QJF51175.1 hypothetical protein G3256_08385 [Roseobacter ponti]